jgi:hypothetical protein
VPVLLLPLLLLKLPKLRNNLSWSDEAAVVTALDFCACVGGRWRVAPAEDERARMTVEPTRLVDDDALRRAETSINPTMQVRASPLYDGGARKDVRDGFAKNPKVDGYLARSGGGSGRKSIR